RALDPEGALTGADTKPLDGSGRPVALDVVVGVARAAAHLVAGIAECVTDVVARVRELVGRALLAVGVAPRFPGLVPDFASGPLGIRLDVFPVHGVQTSSRGPSTGPVAGSSSAVACAALHGDGAGCQPDCSRAAPERRTGLSRGCNRR